MLHDERKFNCSSCPDEERLNRNCHLLRGRKLNESDGSFDKADAVFWVDLNGEPIVYYECPVPYISEETMDVWLSYLHYKNGFLKYGNSQNENSEEWLDLMLLIQSTVAQIENEKFEEQRQKTMPVKKGGD